MKKNIFLIELIIEDLPAYQLSKILKEFLKIFLELLKTNNIVWDKIQKFSTPRRLALKIIDLKNNNKEQTIRIKGPLLKNAYKKNGNITQDTQKWIKKFQINKKNIKKSIINKKKYLTYNIKKNSITLFDVLKKIIPYALLKIPCKNAMFWNESNIKFIRPIRNILILFNNIVIPIKLFGLTSNSTSMGHFFLDPYFFSILHANYYTEKFYIKKKILINQKTRKEKIFFDLINIMKDFSYFVDIKNSLLNEVTSMVEWPKVLIGSFSKKFLKIPKSILIYVMEKQQKYFPVYSSKNKKLLNTFICVSNIESKNFKNVILGNENVLSARFNDVLFFLKKDLLIPFENRINLLKNISFHYKLGTLFEKILRIQKVSIWLSKKIKNVNLKLLTRTIQLSKCDLTTLMVFEYPELQGIIGSQYSKFFNEKKEISCSIKEHYFPKFSTDHLPNYTIAQIISITDKLDTITGIFSIHEEPKKNSDSYAIKRAAIGILRILIKYKIKIRFDKLIKHSLKSYSIKKNVKELITKILFFFKKKFQQFYTKKYSKDLIQSILVLNTTNFLDIYKRIFILHKYKKKKQYYLIIVTYKRIDNILKKLNYSKNLIVLINFKFFNTTEKILFQKIQNIQKKIQNKTKKFCYLKFFKKIKKLCILLKKFFENNLINHENTIIKNNRLILMNYVKEIFFYFADFSCLKIPKKK
ncbi:glycine--tRNA ligase subunit beta [Buchnera aphidicola]|uniref:Glycine--tRNA ligase beta subunit n=1 Tax=Buchnera aphidicola subsp. Tuberolachnus salignus TaxID=98804 RepID=A0A160SXZ8_BUCTT|nr:glycine--tRNA ligase subunit beta [Buchnera aphidicola]CUR53074.1 Glycine--tRNA ligase beta subunit [Buchnera aphidicola (Tuberolachnus salignus)]